MSKRGGHLWILLATPLLAKECRVYIHGLATRLGVPVKGSGLADGIEVAQGKQKVLQVLESAVRGVQRLNAVKKRVDPKVLESLLAKIQAPPLAEIGNMKTLRDIVLGLERLAGSSPVQA